MKAKNKEMLNQMMNELREEMEMLVDPKDRFDAKAKYTELLFKISTVKIDIESNGKESIKEDIAKEEEDTEENLEDIAEEIEYENSEEETESNDPLEESEEVIYVTDEEGNSIDVTDIYNQLEDIEDKEEREQAALYIKEQDCMEEYKSLNMIKNHSDDKLYLAFCIKECGLEVVNEYVSELSSDMFDDIYEYINDNNLEGFTQFMSSEDEEE